MFYEIFGLELTVLNVLSLLIGFVFVLYAGITIFKGKKLTVKDITYIAVFTALAFVLSKIKLFDFPQGGGISLLQFLPLMLLTILTSRRNGVIAGIIFGILGIILGGYILHPIQVLFDYIFPPIAISLITINGKKDRINLLLNSLVVFVMTLTSFMLSGVTFFADFSSGTTLRVIEYALVYNFTGSGIDLIVTIAVLLMLPINRLEQVMTK